jgi:hypothetical protein
MLVQTLEMAQEPRCQTLTVTTKGQSVVRTGYACVHVHEPRWRLENRGAGLGPHVVACYGLGFASNLILAARKVSVGTDCDG